MPMRLFKSVLFTLAALDATGFVTQINANAACNCQSAIDGRHDQYKSVGYMLATSGISIGINNEEIYRASHSSDCRLSCFFQDAFDKDLHFNGQSYSHVSKVRGGDVTNHLYTPNGESFKTATESIQIVELSENLQDKSMWRDRLSPLFTRYNLTPIGSQLTA